MHITVKCFATFRGFQPEDGENFPISDGETVGAVIDRLGIPKDQLRLVFVNSTHSSLDTVLNDGDTLGFFPAIGGG